MWTGSSGPALTGQRLPLGRAGAVVGGHVAAVAGDPALVVVDVDTLTAQCARAPGNDVGQLRHAAELLFVRTMVRPLLVRLTVAKIGLPSGPDSDGDGVSWTRTTWERHEQADAGTRGQMSTSK